LKGRGGARLEEAAGKAGGGGRFNCTPQPHGAPTTPAAQPKSTRPLHLLRCWLRLPPLTAVPPCAPGTRAMPRTVGGLPWAPPCTRRRGGARACTRPGAKGEEKGGVGRQGLVGSQWGLTRGLPCCCGEGQLWGSARGGGGGEAGCHRPALQLCHQGRARWRAGHRTRPQRQQRRAPPHGCCRSNRTARGRCSMPLRGRIGAHPLPRAAVPPPQQRRARAARLPLQRCAPGSARAWWARLRGARCCPPGQQRQQRRRARGARRGRDREWSGGTQWGWRNDV
jgi:hypothetical protein